jgi:hypothetical protein
LLPSGAENLKYSIKEDEFGQSALFDAIIFLIVMIIASSLVSVYANQYSKNVDLNAREDMMNYARNTSEVVFAATLNSTWYQDENREIILRQKGDTKVMNLVLEELALLDYGVLKENFAFGYERDIKLLIRNLVTPGYHFALKGSYTNEGNNKNHIVFISDIIPDYKTMNELRSDKTDYVKQVPRNNLANVEHTQPMIGTSGEATISFLLWR